MSENKKRSSFWENAGELITTVYRWAYKLRSVLLAIPVVIGAIVLAIRNMVQLPDEVGITLLASGEYGLTVGRLVAVLGPLAITALCLVFMFASRKVLYPWLVSLFSLALPVIILLLNTFPA